MTKRIVKFLKRLDYYKIICWLIDTSGLLVLSFTGWAIPLYYDYSVNNIYVLPKIILLRHLTIILIGIFLFRILFLNRSLKMPPILVSIPIFIFLIASSIATTQSLNPYIAFYGCYSRYEGLTSLLNYIILFYLAFFFVNTNLKARIFFASCVLSGILCGGYGFLQHFDKDPNWLIEMGESSTFGNRNFLSAYLVLICPLSFSLFILALSDKIKKKGNRVVKILFYIFKASQAVLFLTAFLFFCITIVIIQTRGAWLGLLSAGILFLILMGRRVFNKQFAVIFVIVFALIISLFFFPQTSPIPRIKEAIKKEEGAVKFAGSAAVRLIVWKSCIPLIKDHPFGVGPDSLKFKMPLYMDSEYYTLEGGVLDKAHNIIIEMAVTTGWFGILSYICLWIVLFFYGIKRRDNILVVGILSLLMGYLVQNLFNFDLVTYTFLFWTGMGVLFGIGREKEKQVTSYRPSVIRIVLFILCIFGLSFLWKMLYIQMSADKIFAQGRNYEASGDLDGSITKYEEALSVLPWEETYFRFLVPQYKNKINQTEDEEVIKKIISRIEDFIKYDPNNTSYYDALAVAYRKLSDERNEEESLWRGVKQNPRSPDVWTNLGVFYSNKGMFDKAVSVYEEALKYQVKGARGTVITLNNLGEAYFRNNDEEKAIWAFSESLKQNPDQAEVNHYIALVYFKIADYKKSAHFCEKAVLLSPNKVQWLNDLGSAYYKLGDLKKTEEAFEKALLLSPDNDYAKKVLSVIKRM